MTADRFRSLLRAAPLEPFTRHLADGRHILVQHRNFVASSPSGRTAIVYQPDESFHIVALLLVTGLEVTPGATPPAPPP